MGCGGLGLDCLDFLRGGIWLLVLILSKRHLIGSLRWNKSSYGGVPLVQTVLCCQNLEGQDRDVLKWLDKDGSFVGTVSIQK